MTYLDLTAALAELDNANELQAFCNDFIANQMLEDLAAALIGD
jgi:hypothetical protein